MSKRKNFELGQRVTWRSQANGTWVRKTGHVVEVVPHHFRPATGQFYNDRDHESYVVEVPGPTPKAKPSLYWPVVANLRPGGRHKLGVERS